MAPMSLRPAFSLAISAPMSKSSCWTRITLTSGHRREEGDLARGADRSVMTHMGLVDGRPDDVGPGKGMVELGTASLEPGHQLGDGGDVRRNVHLFGGNTGLLLDPGEIEEPGAHHFSSAVKGRSAARK